MQSYQLDGRARVRCLTGFEIRPGVTTADVSCLAGAYWDPDPQTDIVCRKTTCEVPPTIPFATLNYTGLQYYDFVSAVFYVGIIMDC